MMTFILSLLFSSLSFANGGDSESRHVYFKASVTEAAKSSDERPIFRICSELTGSEVKQNEMSNPNVLPCPRSQQMVLLVNPDDAELLRKLADLVTKSENALLQFQIVYEFQGPLKRLILIEEF